MAPIYLKSAVIFHKNASSVVLKYIKAKETAKSQVYKEKMIEFLTLCYDDVIYSGEIFFI